jgi:hypothetical protein
MEPMDPGPIPVRAHDYRDGVQLLQAIEDGLRGVVLCELSDIGLDPVRGDTVARRCKAIEQSLKLEPGQPPAVTIDSVAVGDFGMFRPSAAVLEQVARGQGGLPQGPVAGRPLGDRLAPPFGVSMKKLAHCFLPSPAF